MAEPLVMIAEAASHFDAQDNLLDEKANDQIRQLLGSLAAWARRLSAGENPLT